MALQQRTAIARRAALSGRVSPCRPAAASRRGPVKVQALLREWSPTNKEFIDLVLSEFPDKGVATVEEARVSKEQLGSCSPNVAEYLMYSDYGLGRVRSWQLQPAGASTSSLLVFWPILG
jgi:hypothetical protein